VALFVNEKLLVELSSIIFAFWSHVIYYACLKRAYIEPFILKVNISYQLFNKTFAFTVKHSRVLVVLEVFFFGRQEIRYYMTTKC